MPVVSSGTITPGTGAVVFPPSNSNSGTTFASTTGTSSSGSYSSSASGIQSVTGNNVGHGDGLFAGTVGTTNLTLNFKSLIAGTGIEIIQSQESVTFVATGQAVTDTTFSSLPDGPGGFVANAVLIANEFGDALAYTEPATVANTVLTFTGNSFIWAAASASASVNGITEVTSLGSGYSVISSVDLPTLNLRSIYATNGVSVTANSVGLIFTGTTPTGDGNIVVNSTNGVALSLSTTGVASGTYNVVSIVVDSHGRITNASSGNAGTITSALGYTPISNALFGVAGGVATLDSSGLVPTSELPMSAIDSAVSNSITGIIENTVSNAVFASVAGTISNTVNSTLVGTLANTTATLTGVVTGTGPLTDIVTSLSATGVTAGTYYAADIVVGSDGRISSASTGNSVGSSAVLTGVVTGSGPLSNIVTTLSDNGVVPGTYTKAVVDATGRVTNGLQLASSDVTTALGYTPVNNAVLGVAGGIATLNSSGQIPTSQLPASITGAVVYIGTWDASANIPTLTSSVGTKGYYYKVSNAGSTTLNGISTWLVDDTVIFDGVVWDKIAGQDPVVFTVAGRTGNVVLSVTDVANAAPLASPAFTGTPTAPTPSAGDNSTKIATTAFVVEQGYLSNASLSTALGSYVSNTALQSDLANYVLTSTRGVANGVATLNSSGIVPLSQLPSSLGNGSVQYVGITSVSNTISVTGSPVTSNGTIDLELVSISNVSGTYTSPSQVVVDGYGRITHIAAGTGGGIQSLSVVGTGITVTGSPVTNTGTISLSLTSTGVAAGTYVNPTLIIGSDGRITSATGTTSGLTNIATTQSTNFANVYAGVVAGSSALYPILGTSRISVSTGTSPEGITVDLANGVVTPGTYETVTVDSYGRVIAGGGLSASALAGLLTARTFFTFTGTGSQTSFTLANAVGTSATDILVSVGNVIQEPTVAYSFANGVLTFVSAPGANAVGWALGLGSTASGNATGSGSTTTTLTGDVTGTGTGTIATTLAASGVTAGTYTYPTVTVNSKGLVTSIENGSAPSGGSSINVYSFQVNFDSTGNISETTPFGTAPSGWTLTLINNTTVQVTHNLSTFPYAVTTCGYNSGNNAFTFKAPVSNYSTSLNCYIPGTSTTPNSFVLNGLTATFTNATASEFVIVQVLI